MKKIKPVTKKEIVVHEESTYLGYDVKTMITVFLLVMAYPVGLVMMFVWMKWKGWVKFLVTLPAVLGLVVAVLMAIIFGVVIGEGLRGDLIIEGPEEVTPTIIMREVR